MPDRSRASARPVPHQRSAPDNRSSQLIELSAASFKSIIRPSLQLGAGILDDVSPAIDLGLHIARKTIRCGSRQRLEGNPAKLVACGWVCDQFSDLRSQLIDDRPRNAGWRHDPLPCNKLKTDKTALGEGRDVRGCGDSLWRGHAE